MLTFGDHFTYRWGGKVIRLGVCILTLWDCSKAYVSGIVVRDVGRGEKDSRIQVDANRVANNWQFYPYFLGDWHVLTYLIPYARADTKVRINV